MARCAIWISALTVAGAVSATAPHAGTQGVKVFSDQKCALCHSVGGKGNPKGALDEVGTKLSKDDIRAWIVDPKRMTAKTKASRKPLMKTYALPKEDVDALVEYLSAMKKKK